MQDDNGSTSKLPPSNPQNTTHIKEARKEIARLEKDNAKMIVRYTSNLASIATLKESLPKPLIQVGAEPLAVTKET